MMQGAAGWWLVGAVFMVFCMLMMAWMMSGIMGHGQSGHSAGTRRDDPERTLAERLAKGEIDVQEYRRLLEIVRDGDLDAPYLRRRAN